MPVKLYYSYFVDATSEKGNKLRVFVTGYTSSADTTPVQPLSQVTFLSLNDSKVSKQQTQKQIPPKMTEKAAKCPKIYLERYSESLRTIAQGCIWLLGNNI